MPYTDIKTDLILNEISEEQLHSQENLPPNQYWLTDEDDNAIENIEQLWMTSAETYDNTTGVKTLSSPYTNYKLIILVWGSSGFGCYQTNVIPTNMIGMFGLSNNFGVNFSGTSTQRSCYGSFTSLTQFTVNNTNNAGLKAIIGIK